MTKRPPLTEEQKQVLRDRLALARAAKASKPKEIKEPKKPNADKVAAPPTSTPSKGLHTPWSIRQWQSEPLDRCEAQLALLRRDFEEGARIVGQRSDTNNASAYHCMVCNSPVADSRWNWKQDYLDVVTGLYKSVVTCSQQCSMVLFNDDRRKQQLRDLMQGKTGSGLVEKNLP